MTDYNPRLDPESIAQLAGKQDPTLAGLLLPAKRPTHFVNLDHPLAQGLVIANVGGSRAVGVHTN